MHHEIFTAVKHLATDNIAGFMDVFELNNEWTAARIDEVLDAFYDGRQRIRLDPEARNHKHTHTEVLEEPRRWRINQTLCDPEERNDWSLTLIIDLERSDEKKQPVMQLENLGPIV